MLGAALWAPRAAPSPLGGRRDTALWLVLWCLPKVAAFDDPVTTASCATLPSSTISSDTCNTTRPGCTPSSSPGFRAACPNPNSKPKGLTVSFNREPKPEAEPEPKPITGTSVTFARALTRFHTACTSSTSRVAPTRRSSSTTCATANCGTFAPVACQASHSAPSACTTGPAQAKSQAACTCTCTTCAVHMCNMSTYMLHAHAHAHAHVHAHVHVNM